jgi:hypothetical protein
MKKIKFYKKKFYVCIDANKHKTNFNFIKKNIMFDEFDMIKQIKNLENYGV